MNLDTSKHKLAIQLRQQGLMYSEISQRLGGIPKATLSGWLSGLEVGYEAQKKIERRKRDIFSLNIQKATATKQMRRKEHFAYMEGKNRGVIAEAIKNDFPKIALAMLYLGEGKKQGGSVSFGNSSPEIIQIFLSLLRHSYQVDESKFRVTVQCRADQDTEVLQKFWCDITTIPQSQFYTPRIDPRTVGVPSRKKNYKGVCRIDYFSAEVFNELLIIANMYFRALSSAG